MTKSNEDIKQAVERARKTVQDIYRNDERLKQDPRPDSGVARETDIVFQEVLRHLLEN